MRGGVAGGEARRVGWGGSRGKRRREREEGVLFTEVPQDI